MEGKLVLIIVAAVALLVTAALLGWLVAIAALAWTVAMAWSFKVGMRVITGACLMGLGGALLAYGLACGLRPTLPEELRPLAYLVGVGAGSILGAIVGGVRDILHAMQRPPGERP